jgi:hypothetical protein
MNLMALSSGEPDRPWDELLLARRDVNDLIRLGERTTPLC